MKKIIISAPIEFIPDLKVEMTNEFDCTFSYQANKKETINLLKKINSKHGWSVLAQVTSLMVSLWILVLHLKLLQHHLLEAII